MTPRVSVVIPCHNQGQYIDTAVDSILRQIYANFEILIVNDASTDELTNRKLAAYSKSKTTVINIQAGNVSAARNVAIRKTRAEYILTLDGDDYFQPTFLHKAVDLLDRQPHIGVVSCWTWTFGTRSGLWKPKGGGLEDFLVRNNCNSGALFRRSCWEAAGGYDEELPGYGDWDFWLGIAAQGWRIEIVPEPLFCKRALKHSMINGSNRNRAKLLARIVANHRAHYERHVDAIFIRMDEQLHAARHRSVAYRLGHYLWGLLKRIVPTQILQKIYAGRIFSRR